MWKYLKKRYVIQCLMVVVEKLKEIRNSDRKLVAIYEEATLSIIIIRRNCETRINLHGEVTIEIINIKHDPD